MSSTAVANLLVPIAVGVAMWSPTVGALLVACSAALGMSLPVSTPPNAIAYASRRLALRDMAVAGSIVSAFGFAILMAAFLLVMRYTEFFGPAC
jgi:sodium-dependent dicarboxylate transporter 2/3/5